jgi:hypothetical protein
MVKINWTNLALQDLDEIAEFISKDSIRYAQITVKYLFESPSISKHIPKLEELSLILMKKTYVNLFGEVIESFIGLLIRIELIF